MDHIRAAEFAQQQWPVAELRHDRADVLDPQERVEWLRRNRIDWNNPRVDVGVVVLRLGTVAERRPIARELAHELLARADKLMYEAKGTRTGQVHRVGVRIQNGSLLETTTEELLDVVTTH